MQCVGCIEGITPSCAKRGMSEILNCLSMFIPMPAVSFSVYLLCLLIRIEGPVITFIAY